MVDNSRVVDTMARSYHNQLGSSVPILTAYKRLVLLGGLCMYYSYREVDGRNCPLNVILSRRGLGKTFTAVKKGLYSFFATGKIFVYVVETEEMRKELSKDNGSKFFGAMYDVLSKSKNKRDIMIYEGLTQGKKGRVTEDDVINRISGGVITIDGVNAGFIIAISEFAKMKRNNFVNVGHVIIDEFIPEEIDIRHLKTAYKITSLIQSIARLQDIKIYMLGNTIRNNDIMLVKLKIDDLKPGEIRVVKDKYGPIMCAHLVDNADYDEFVEVADASVAGRFASLLGEDNLEQNTYKLQLEKDYLLPPILKPNKFMMCLHGEYGAVRIHATKDYKEYYVMNDYGKNNTNRFCIEKKFIAPNVVYLKDWEDLFLIHYQQGRIKFESTNIYVMFKSIMKMDIKK